MRAGPGGTVERDAIGGFALQVTTRAVGKGWAATIAAGVPGTPLPLEITRQGAQLRSARLALALGATGDPGGFTSSIDLGVVSQDLVPLQVRELLHLDASVKPDPKAGRTVVEIGRLAAADGALTVSARAELSDGNAAALREVDARVDLGRLLAVAPQGTVPLSLGGGAVQVHVAGLELAGGAPQLAPNGAVRVGVDLSRVRLPLVPGAATVSEARADIEAQSAPQGRWDRWNARVSVRVAAADVTGPTRLSVRGVRLQAQLRELKIDPATPVASSGSVTLAGEVGNLDARTPAMRAVVDGLALRVGAALSGRPPYAATLELPIEMVHLFDGRGRRLLASPVKASVSAAHVVPDASQPLASRGDLQTQIDLGALHASIDAHKRRDAADVDLTLKADSLAAARPFLPPPLSGKLDWDRMAVDLQTKAQVQRLAGTPLVKQETVLRLDGLRAGRTGARHLVLQAKSSGDVRRHEADSSLSAEGLTLDGHAAPDTRLHLTANVDRPKPSAKVHLDADGAAHLALDATVGFAAGPRRIDADVDLKADHLALAAVLPPFVPALQGVDLARASLAVTARAAVTGVIERMDRDGGVHPARDPQRSAGGSLAVTVHVADVATAQGDSRVALGTLDWKLGVRGEARRRELSSELRLERVRLMSGEQRFELTRLQNTTAATLEGDLAAGPAELTNHLVLAGLRQDVAPFVPTDEIVLALAARRQPDGLLRVLDLHLTDAGAGTALSLNGAVDPGMDRRMSVHGRFDQDLSKLRRLPAAMTASGHVGLSFEVDSPDLESFRTRALLALDGVNLRAPPAGLAVETMDAQIPIAVRVVLGPQGLTIPRDVHINPYASLRFADQHPLLSRSSFLSIARLTRRFATIAPLAGNLRDRREHHRRSTSSSSACAAAASPASACVDWERRRRHRASCTSAPAACKSSHGEPFDGNSAVVISTARSQHRGARRDPAHRQRHLLICSTCRIRTTPTPADQPHPARR